MNDDLTPDSAAVHSDPERIFLSPACDDYSDEGRTWCSEDTGKCPDCGDPTVEYIRADICSERIAAAEKAARVGALEEAAQVKIRLSNLASEPYSFDLFDAGRQAKEDAIRAIIADAEAQPGTEPDHG
jgi:hypothetical protein